MKKLTILFLICSLLSTSCSRYIRSGNGGYSDVSLSRNSDEYTIKRLAPIELTGSSIFGIPGWSTNNRNKNKSGMVFRFNGVEIGKVSRALPIITLLGATFAYGKLIQNIAGYKKSSGGFDYYDNEEFRIKLAPALLIGAPLAGITNNLIWDGAAMSGLTNQIYYKMVEDNPDVDVFFNPKYKIDYKLRLFSQEATINANVMGATLKMK